MPGIPPSRRSLQASDVFVGFMCLYLLTLGRSPPLGDAIPMWEAARNLVRHGSFAIETRWPINAPLGRGGHYYPVAALLACLISTGGRCSRRAAAGFLLVLFSPLFLGLTIPIRLWRATLRGDSDTAADPK